MIQYRMYQTPIQDAADLRQCLVDTWSGFSASIVDNAIDEWRKKNFRPKWIKKGGHFEHLL